MGNITNKTLFVECIYKERTSFDDIIQMKEDAENNGYEFEDPNKYETQTAWDEVTEVLKNQSKFSWADSGIQSNGYRWICLFPCGSKDGWETKKEWDKLFEEIVDLGKSYAFLDFKLVSL